VFVLVTHKKQNETTYHGFPSDAEVLIMLV